MFQRGTWKSCMITLNDIYKESGGKENLQIESELEQEHQENVTGFEAIKILLVKKLEIVRHKLQERDQMNEQQEKLKKKNNKQWSKNKIVQIEQKNHIRKMILFLKRDLENLQRSHQKSQKKKILQIFGKFSNEDQQANKQIIDQQKQDLDLFERHIHEIELLFKRETLHQQHSEEDEQKRNLLSLNKTDSAEDILKQEGKQDLLEDEKKPLIVKEEDLPRDPMFSNLPKIDISKSLSTVEKNKKMIDEGLKKFGEKIDKLNTMTEEIADEIDVQQNVINKVDRHADLVNVTVKDVNEKVEEQINSVSSTIRYIILLIILIVITVLVAICALFICYMLKALF